MSRLNGFVVNKKAVKSKNLIKNNLNRCGILCWRPKFLEPFRDIRAFLAATCFISCIQSSFSGYTSSQITTLEKRFAIGSILIGIINSFFEIGYICCVLTVSYAGAKGRVPFWIACGLFSMSAGAFLFSLPNFIFPYNILFYLQSNFTVCPLSNSGMVKIDRLEPECFEPGVKNYFFLPILMCSQLLIGAGSTPILTLAPPFVDDHVSPSKAPAMIASIYAAAAMGPVFGYGLGALMLQCRADFLTVNKTKHPLNPKDVTWIGAWWAGYIILGAIVLFAAFVILLFPHNLRSYYVNKYYQSYSGDDLANASTLKVPNKDLIMQSNSHALIDSKDLFANTQNTVLVSLAVPTEVECPVWNKRTEEQCINLTEVPLKDYSTSEQIDIDSFRTKAIIKPDSRSSTDSSCNNLSDGSARDFIKAAIAAITATHSEDSNPSTDSELDDLGSFGNIDTLSCYHSCCEEPQENNQSGNTELKFLNFYPSRENSSRYKADYVLHISNRGSLDDIKFLTWHPHNLFQSRQLSSLRDGNPLSYHPSINFRHHPHDTNFYSFSSMATSPVLSQKHTTRPFMHPLNSTLDQMPYKAAVKLSYSANPSIKHKLSGCSNQSNSNSKQSYPNLRANNELLSGASSSRTALSEEKHRKILPLFKSTLFDEETETSKIRKDRNSLMDPSSVSKDELSTDAKYGVHSNSSRNLRETSKSGHMRSRSHSFVDSWTKDLPKSINSLLRNKIYLVVSICIGCEMFIIIGFASFLPKYLETEYGISKSQASLIAGGLVVPAGAFGILIGGLLLNKFHFHRQAAIIFVFCINLIIISCLGTFFFLGCNTPNFTGYNTAYHNKYLNSATTSNLCSSPCLCDVDVWRPVCHPASGVTFASPCVIGCTSGPLSDIESNYVEVFENCSCLLDANNKTTSPPTDRVYSGLCSQKCNTLLPFVCLLTTTLFLTGVIQNPLLMVTMRSVKKAERSFALGLQFVIIRLFANVPSPIAFGRVIDGACLFWNKKCGLKGDCAFMDLHHLTFYITGLGATVKCASVIVYILLIYLLHHQSVEENFNDMVVFPVNLKTIDSSLDTTTDANSPVKFIQL